MPRKNPDPNWPFIDRNLQNQMLGSRKVIRLMKLWDTNVRQRIHGEGMPDGRLRQEYQVTVRDG